MAASFTTRPLPSAPSSDRYTRPSWSTVIAHWSPGWKAACSPYQKFTAAPAALYWVTRVPYGLGSVEGESYTYRKEADHCTAVGLLSGAEELACRLTERTVPPAWSTAMMRLPSVSDAYTVPDASNVSAPM